MSFLVSLLSFQQQYPLHLRIFSILLGLTFLTEVFAAWLGKFFFHLGNNNAIYNLFVLIEFSVYAFYYYLIIEVVWIKKLIRIFSIVFPFFWLWTVFFVLGINKWNSYVIISGAVFTVFFALGYYYQILKTKKDIVLFSHPEFWIATGMLVFYSCQIPYFGTLNYLIKKNLVIARSLLSVLDVIDAAMYMLFIYAFICPIIPKIQGKSR